MDKEYIKNKIEELLDDHELLKQIAIKMDTKNIEINYEDWFNKYPIGIIISELNFDYEYIKNNIQECFIKAKIFDCACSEEWSLDFFNILETEREKLMDLQFYKNIFTYKQKIMRFVEYDKFSKEFIWFTSSNGMSKEMQNYFLDEFKDGVIIEIGGCYAGDHECYIIGDKKVFVVNYGIWD
jgi:hypothetical protein